MIGEKNTLKKWALRVHRLNVSIISLHAVTADRSMVRRGTRKWSKSVYV